MQNSQFCETTITSDVSAKKQKQESGRPSPTASGSSVIGEAQRPVKKEERAAPEPKHISNSLFINQKLANCKKFLHEVKYLENTSLLKQFMDLTYQEFIDWIAWITGEQKSAAVAIREMFEHHKLDVSKVPVTQFEKMQLYFQCFMDLVNHDYGKK